MRTYVQLVICFIDARSLINNVTWTQSGHASSKLVVDVKSLFEMTENAS